MGGKIQPDLEIDRMTLAELIELLKIGPVELVSDCYSSEGLRIVVTATNSKWALITSLGVDGAINVNDLKFYPSKR